MDDAHNSDSAPQAAVAQLPEKIVSLRRSRETAKAHGETLERGGNLTADRIEAVADGAYFNYGGQLGVR